MSTPLKPHAGAQVFRLPDLGEGLTEAGLVQWLVAVGDTITTDQPIAEVETAKSIVELPSPFAGVVTALHGTAGDTIDVGAPVLEVADPLTSPAPSAPSPGAQPEHEAYREEERAGSGNVLIGYGTTARTAKGRRRPSAASVSAPREQETVLARLQSRAEVRPAGKDKDVGQWRRNGAGAQILADLGLGKLRVLGTPRRQVGLSGFGLEIVETVEPAGAATAAAG